MTLLAMLLLSLGALFLLVAAIGVFRLPDPLQRMHSATKAGTLGATLMLLGVMLSGTLDGMMTGSLVILFLLLTLPIGAQLLGRAAYVSGTKLEGLEQDPLEGELERAEDQPEETA
ncbi:monovalent cation/H(+) antiporter subunit G [Sphingobium lignivorans]|uniref:Multicomponent Na+:H+ antiporter subunit G n=1 Tax=Sphingobium lignivorans TaxID=2735886 RepID=A0ABR6NDS4_9SPHN|nr:monovalent cation/H(+) antiporter subunit G [Sphingobium lignivorans]MBB5985430.1 multicomponent Na+:H+ antiporter subunit G [Sphingobium lignivorans]